MKRVWNPQLDNLLRRHYPKGDLKALAQRIGVTVGAVKCRAQVLGLKRKVNIKKSWTERQIAYLKKHYADTPIEVLMEKTRHDQSGVWQKARALGLSKSKEFIAEVGRIHAQHPNAIAHRFKPGQEPSNKGKRIEDFMSAEGIAASSRTRFKKGHQPHNTRAVGTDCVHGDGYVYHKTEQGPVLKHRHVWEQHHGPVPDGYVVAFRDGNRQNCDIENLCLLSRADNARRRTEEETPEQRRIRVERCQATRNKSIRRDKIRLHWGLEPIGKLVKRW